MTASRTRTKTPPPATPEFSGDTPDEVTPDDGWGDLQTIAVLTDRDAPKHRPAVDVPAHVITFVETLYKTRKVAFIPLKSDNPYDEYMNKKAGLQAAADKASVTCSATVTPADSDKKPIKGDGWKNQVAWLRVTVGDRRGSTGPRKDTPAASPAEAASDDAASNDAPETT